MNENYKERRLGMKKVLSLILCTLLLLTNIYVFAEEVDYCEKYGVGCQEEEAIIDNREIGFDNFVSFRNADCDGDSVDFLFKGYNWDLDKEMKIELSLIPQNNKSSIIKKEMKKKHTQTKINSDGVVDYRKYEASVNIDIDENNSTTPIYYDVQITADGKVVLTSAEVFMVAGKENNEIKEPTFNWSDSGINVAVDGNNINFPDQKPLLDLNTSRTYVPVRFLAENLGAEVDWDNDNQVVVIKNKFIEGENTDRLHYLKIGENRFVSIKYDGDLTQDVYIFEFPEDIFPTLVNGRTMLPFRYVAELLGSQVYYNKETNTAHCVKRDMSMYEGKAQVISTVFGDYFVEELKAFRKNYWKGTTNSFTGESVVDIYFNGSLGDICTWAAFDHLEHPEWKTIDAIGVEHLHTFSNSIEDEEGPEVSAFGPYARKYFNGQRQWSVDSPVENGVVVKGDNIYTYGYKTLSEAKNIKNDLAEMWGLYINSTKSTDKLIHLYDEETYREFSRDLLAKWDSSPAHRGALAAPTSKAVGISVVEDYAYYNAVREY